VRSMLVLALASLAIACGGDSQKGSAAQRETSGAATSTGFSGVAAYNYAKAQVDFGPRVPGTPATKKAGDWIVNQMRARADTVIVQSFILHDGRPRSFRFGTFSPGSAPT